MRLGKTPSYSASLTGHGFWGSVLERVRPSVVKILLTFILFMVLGWLQYSAATNHAIATSCGTTSEGRQLCLTTGTGQEPPERGFVAVGYLLVALPFIYCVVAVAVGGRRR